MIFFFKNTPQTTLNNFEQLLHTKTLLLIFLSSYPQTSLNFWALAFALSYERGPKWIFLCPDVNTILDQTLIFWNKIAKLILWSAPTLQRNVHDKQGYLCCYI